MSRPCQDRRLKGLDVEVTIRQLEDGDDALASLERWLQGDVDLARRARVQPMSGQEPEGMGGVVELVNVVLTHAEALSSFALSYVAWRSQNRRSASVVISIDDRRTVDREGGEESVQRILRLVAQQDDQRDGETVAGGGDEPPERREGAGADGS
jgi:LDH2 family malate/lactate/ureidoglycolate dehydrogenase